MTNVEAIDPAAQLEEAFDTLRAQELAVAAAKKALGTAHKGRHAAIGTIHDALGAYATFAETADPKTVLATLGAVAARSTLPGFAHSVEQAREKFTAITPADDGPAVGASQPVYAYIRGVVKLIDPESPIEIRLRHDGDFRLTIGFIVQTLVEKEEDSGDTDSRVYIEPTTPTDPSEIYTLMQKELGNDDVTWTSARDISAGLMVLGRDEEAETVKLRAAEIAAKKALSLIPQMAAFGNDLGQIVSYLHSQPGQTERLQAVYRRWGEKINDDNRAGHKNASVHSAQAEIVARHRAGSRWSTLNAPEQAQAVYAVIISALEAFHDDARDAAGLGGQCLLHKEA
jgi:hypothetical protein